MNRIQKFVELSKRFPSLIPLNGKQPIEKNWTRYCYEPRPFNPREFEGRNAGVTTGPANGRIVIDVDDYDAFRSWLIENRLRLPRTFTVYTGGKGRSHLDYERPSDGRSYKNRSFDSFDIKADGGVVVAPGSIHPDTGQEYIISHDWPVAPAPVWLLNLCVNGDGIAPSSQERGGVPIDIDRLSISDDVKALIRDGKEKGKRSEAIQKVINALVAVHLSDSQIISIFDTWPIGEKYHEKGNSKREWLLSQVEKGHKYVSQGKPSKVLVDCTNKSSLDFPSHTMSGAAGYFAHVYSQHIEAPAHFLFMAYLTCLGAVLSLKLKISSVLQTQPRLFTVLLGESATERKSTVLKLVAEHFQEVLNYFNVCWGIGSAEGLLKVLGRTDTGTLLIFDEMKTFVSKCKIDSSVLLPMVNSLYESNCYETHTKNNDELITDAYVSFLAATTISTYERIYNPTFLNIGFPNRVFLVPGTARRQYSIPQKIPQLHADHMKKNLENVLNCVGEGLELCITPDAQNLYDDWYMNIEPSIHAKRLDTYSLRLMQLLAVNDLKQKIDIVSVRNAIALCDWQLEVRKLHDPIDADNKNAEMEGRIRRTLKHGPLKDYELKQKTNANRSGLWIYHMSTKNLERAKEIGWNTKTKKWYLLEK